MVLNMAPDVSQVYGASTAEPQIDMQAAWLGGCCSRAMENKPRFRSTLCTKDKLKSFYLPHYEVQAEVNLKIKPCVARRNSRCFPSQEDKL